MLALLTLAAAGTQIALYDGRAPAGPGPSPAAADPAVASGGEIAALEGLSGPPTLFGRVLSVPDAATAVVEVERQPITVSVVGVDITETPACARDDATAFARRTLVGEMVTLVPDPTLPTTGEAGTWRAYLVLGSQQSYTDLALRAGWVSAGQGRYRPGFLVGEQLARDADAGMWGPPCNRPAPS